MPTLSSIGSFPDATSVSDWAINAMKWARQASRNLGTRRHILRGRALFCVINLNLKQCRAHFICSSFSPQKFRSAHFRGGPDGLPPFALNCLQGLGKATALPATMKISRLRRPCSAQNLPNNLHTNLSLSLLLTVL